MHPLSTNHYPLITKVLPFRTYKVHGESMAPTLRPGDLLLGSAWIKPKVGHVVVVKRKPLHIKRIKKIDKAGIWVEGDNSDASTDSRQFGYVNSKDIIAVIFMKLR